MSALAPQPAQPQPEPIGTAVTAKSALIGSWTHPVDGTLTVTHLLDPVNGDVLQVAWDNGRAVTVLYEETAQFYLGAATKFER